jgi:Fe-S cluster assembly ATP-binding protein
MQGRIFFKGVDITSAPIYERIQMGMGASFQRPPIVKGLKTRQMVDICNRSGEDYFPLAERLNFTELLQLLVQKPDFIMLDEPESGVDIENMRLIGEVAGELLERHLMRTRTRSGLIITHTGYILDYTNADLGHVMIDGRLVCSSNPYQIFKNINEKGFEECVKCIK